MPILLPGAVEPVELELFKQHARISTSAEDALCGLYLRAAREFAESHLGRPLISQQLTKTYKIDEVCLVPEEDIVSISGFYSTVEQIRGAYDYFINYTKGIVVSRDYPIDYGNLPTYQVTYNVVVDPATVPDGLKTVLYQIASSLYENRETGSNPLRIKHMALLNQFRDFS